MGVKVRKSLDSSSELRQKNCYPGWVAEEGKMIRCAKTDGYRGGNG